LTSGKYYKGIFQMDEIISSVVERWVGDNVALFILSGVIAAVVLFAVRRRVRSVYGIIEIAAGLALLYTSFHVAAGFSKDFGPGFQMFRTTVAFTAALGGVFAMIRGLDNIWEARMSRRGR
jgi:TRAP-type C4-dicarboxylate transport system permease small subunit